MCVLHQEILEIECARAKTQHKIQKFTRASVVKSDVISMELLACKMIEFSKFITSSGIHYKLLMFGIEMHLKAKMVAFQQMFPL